MEMITGTDAQTRADEAYAAGCADERARIAAILTSPAAKGRTTLANHLAFSSDIDLEAALEVLGMTPAATGPSIPSIEQRSAGLPEVGGNFEVGTGTEAAKAGWARAIKATQHDHAMRNLQPLPA